MPRRLSDRMAVFHVTPSLFYSFFGLNEHGSTAFHMSTCSMSLQPSQVPLSLYSGSLSILKSILIENSAHC